MARRIFTHVYGVGNPKVAKGSVLGRDKAGIACCKAMLCNGYVSGKR